MAHRVVPGALNMCHAGETVPIKLRWNAICDRQNNAPAHVTNSKRDLCDCEPSQHLVFNLQPTTVLLGLSQSQKCAQPIDYQFLWLHLLRVNSWVISI